MMKFSQCRHARNLAPKGSPGDTQTEALGSLWPPFCLSGCACDRFERKRAPSLQTVAHQHDFKAETGPNQGPQKKVGGIGAADVVAR